MAFISCEVIDFQKRSRSPILVGNRIDLLNYKKGVSLQKKSVRHFKKKLIIQGRTHDVCRVPSLSLPNDRTDGQLDAHILL